MGQMRQMSLMSPTGLIGPMSPMSHLYAHLCSLYIEMLVLLGQASSIPTLTFVNIKRGKS
jgi:hypothetical protein